MQYKRMGHNRTKFLDISQLTGGLNVSAQPSLIDNDELADVRNLRLDHGALVTREAVCVIGNEPLLKVTGKYVHIDKVHRQTFEIDGKRCVVAATCVSNDTTNVSKMTVQVVSLDGELMKAYTMDVSAGVYDLAMAPCDPKTVGAAFLIVYHGNVYIPDDKTATLRPLSASELYAPLVMVNGASVADTSGLPLTAAAANGVMYEGFNALSLRYRAQFTPNVGSGTEYYVLPTEITGDLTMHILSSSGETNVCLKSGAEAVGFTIASVHYTAQAFGTGYVKVSPALPKSSVSGTVTITCDRVGVRETNGMLSVSQATWFGGTQNKLGGTRLFLANPSKAMLMWSDVGNPLYFPENNYMVVGDPSQKITALEKQSDMLVIFKEREMFYTTYVQGEIDAEAVANGTNADAAALQAYFPLTQLSPNIGCRCPHSIALCRDRLVWMDSDARVYALVVAGAYSERNVREIGQKIRNFLLEHTTQTERKASSAVDHKGCYRLMVGRYMPEFDYNVGGFVNVSSYTSGERASRHLSWMVQEYDFGDATQMLVGDGADKALVFSTASHYEAGKTLTRVLYTFEDADKDRYRQTDGTVSERDIPVTLTTKTYEFGDPTAYKRLKAIYVLMRADTASVRVVADDVLPSDGKRYHSDDLHAHLLIPGEKRCRSLALRVDATGAVCIRGWRIHFAMFGTVK